MTEEGTPIVVVCAKCGARSEPIEDDPPKTAWRWALVALDLHAKDCPGRP